MTFGLVLLTFLSAGPQRHDPVFDRLGELLITAVSPDCEELQGYDVAPAADRVLYYGRLRGDTAHFRVWLNDKPLVRACDSVHEYGFTPSGRPYVCYSADGLEYVDFDGALSKGLSAILRDSLQDTRLVLSPDGNRIAFAARDGIWTVAVIDLKPGPQYTMVRNIIFGPGGNYYYLAQKGNAWLLVADGKEGKPYDGISELALLPRTARPLFIATDKEQNLLVADGRASRPWREITEVTFTPGDSLPAYVACDSNRWYVIEDTVIRIREQGIILHSLHYKSDTREPVYVVVDAGFNSLLKVDGHPFMRERRNIGHLAVSPDGRFIICQSSDSTGNQVWVNREPVGAPGALAGDPIFSPDDRHYAFAVVHDSLVSVTTDSAASPAYDDVSELQFSPDSRNLAFVARNHGRSFVVLDGREGPGYDAVGYLQFLPGTGKSAYLAVNGNETREVVSGQPGKVWDDVGPARFSPDGTRIAYPARQGNNFYLVCTPVP
jgi:Tol biopolymer transport system component